ncbi:MAG: hypothetical protein NT133_20775 [Alphaproteobacteria bacterium]|nr:hypothetical protein [Alphaproteobacteria bacterium]
MSTPPLHRPHACAEDRIAALLGGMLWALLAALLGGARRRRAADAAMEQRGVTVVVLRALADAEAIAEPYVEWVAVPAPWRAGRLLPQIPTLIGLTGVRCRGLGACLPARGPPATVLPC